MPLAQTTTDNFPMHLEYQGMLAYVDYWVGRQDSSPATHFGATTLTYAELAERARTYATGLANHGVKPGTKVAVAVARSEALIPLLLAIWSLRAAYVPIDPAHPLARQIYILEDSQANVMVADEPRTDLKFAGKEVALKALQQTPAHPSKTLAPADYVPTDCAYLIYTSGSTGNPKGVVITQGNLINFLLAMAAEPGLQQRDRLLAITTISFDIHILELFLPLLVGAQVIVASRQAVNAPAELQHLIDSHQITVMQATPTTWRMLLNDWRPHQPMKILVGGEALPAALCPQLHAASTELWNMYGPTETTVWSTCHLVHPNDNKIYIGHPIRNTTVFVVDDTLQPVPHGVTGELLIGGAGVSAGYYRNAELTADRFIHNAKLANGPLYRTGDAVIHHSNGAVEYINRLDNQIKVRGFRIEPAEIEKALESAPDIQQAVVVAADLGTEDKRLVAFYLGANEAVPKELQNHCSGQLPAHMVPHYFIKLEQFPMTANLKVDRKTLGNMAISFLNPQSSPSNGHARDDLDRSLLAVWEKNLAIQDISIDDDFFDLGGHSLLALQVLSDMHKVTGLRFSYSTFFEKPTLRALRDSLGDKSRRAASVVKLNNATEGEPIFCLCGVQIYRELAQQFGGQRPVYGIFAEKEFAIIEAQTHHDTLDYSLRDLMQSYLNAVQRQGSYPSVSLVGLSFGGFVALEVADALRKQGIQVSNVVLLDTYLTTGFYRSIRKTFTDIKQRLQRERLIDLRAALLRRWHRFKAKLGKTQNKIPTDMNLIKRERDLAYDGAANRYENQPKNYNFDALLIKAARTQFGLGFKAKYDYDLKTIIHGQLHIRQVDADHLGLMTGNAVCQVFQSIQEYEQRR